MNHNCEDTEALLSGYLDGELTQGDRQRVEVIMEDCQDCAQTFEDMKKLIEFVKENDEWYIKNSNRD